ncbi:hypothetical protein ECZU25_10690 [Escherichia coli]|nr:hypothetical protein ECZU25_10690 [Escherichia coli]
MAALRDGDASAQANVSNVNGNSATTTHAYSVDATAPTVTINTIAGDDILNAAEAGAALTITGSSTAEAGQTVTVTLNGANYTGTVQTDGSWSISVPPADLSALTASNYTVSAAVSDKVGNPASVNHNLTVDTSVPVVTINTVAGDDVINATEHARAQIISGSATGAATGSAVTVTIGTNTFTTVLDASGNWSVGVPASVVSALANGTVTINASVTDAAGNSGSATHLVTVNTGLPSITFNAISGDNVLNADEKGQPLTISGSSTGLATGAQVTVTLNGHNYSATTDAAGNWTLTVPVSDLAALGPTISSAPAPPVRQATSPAAGRIYWSIAACRASPSTPWRAMILSTPPKPGPIKPSAGGHSCRRWRYGYRHAGRQHLHHHGTGQLKLEYQRSGSRSPGVGQWRFDH